MLAFVFAPFYVAVNIYLIWWVFRLLDTAFPHRCTKQIKIIGAILFLFLCLSPLLAYLTPISPFKKAIARISNYWMGIFLYAVLVIVIFDFIQFILKRIPWFRSRLSQSKKVFVRTGCFALVLIAAISIYGIENAKNIRVTRYAVDIEAKQLEKESLKIVLIADLHMGYSIGWKHIEKMVERINEQQPDLVCIAGDIFDNHYEAMDEPEKIKQILQKIESTYGVYACYGNHDYEEDILAGFTFSSEEGVEISRQMRDFLQDANIRTLEDEVILIDNKFYLAGRQDYSSGGKSGVSRKKAEALLEGLDKTKPIIVMDHQPKEMDELAKAGADLDLCGHTHDGQLFPGNIITDRMWENSYGYLKKGNLQQIVTSGVGIFGPYMRVGTKSEIVVVDVAFQ